MQIDVKRRLVPSLSTGDDNNHLALACLETRVGLVDHVDAALATYQTVCAMTALQ